LSDAQFRALARLVAARYPANDRFARHFAQGKLTGDPVFSHLVSQRLVPPGVRVLDLGCGQGLLALLLEAAGTPAASYHGIDLRPHDIERARAAAPNARWAVGDVRTETFPASDVAVILDVLHYLEPGEQRDVLTRVRDALAGGGVLLLRVADANGSLRFRYTLWVDRVVTGLRGGGWPRLHPRPVGEWRALLEELGFSVATQAMSAGTAFENVLCVARYDDDESCSPSSSAHTP
jgi:SAM-dependent methyltransferase